MNNQDHKKGKAKGHPQSSQKAEPSLGLRKSQRTKRSTLRRPRTDREETLAQLPTKRPRSSSSEESEGSGSNSSEEEVKVTLKPNLRELCEHRDSLLEKLKGLRHHYGNRLNPIEEPERNNCFFDQLLAEMTWMATDFEKERKSKQNKAKKLLKAVHSFLEQKRARQSQEELSGIETQKRLARKVSKMIASHWKKIERLGAHVKHVQVEEQRQDFRNKRLDSLVQKQLELSKRIAQKINKDYGTVNIYLKRSGNEWDHCEDEEIQVLREEHPDFGTAPQYTLPVPFLLRHELREYQRVGLHWLVTLHDKRMNGILADEMGLGKTIQTIALLAYLACERRVWGPHLIVVPTSIIINWEMELKRWCPGLKVLTYYGSQRERKEKRIGWSRLNSFHVCITSYQLVVQDQFVFKRKRWYYLILDEAQHIKNFHSQRWQVLLGFKSCKRLMLTGTPLQNDVMELWSLLHFLMPRLFYSHEDFHAWFSSPFSHSIAQNTDFSAAIVKRLHSILRPFLLRRMKKDVESQLPSKSEHILFCSLSRRQQFLYDEYLEHRFARSADSVGIMNVLMQLRKVCNHPDLFAPKTVQSPFWFPGLRLPLHAEFLLDDNFLGPMYYAYYPGSSFAGLPDTSVLPLTELPDLGKIQQRKSQPADRLWPTHDAARLFHMVACVHASYTYSAVNRRGLTHEVYTYKQVIGEELRPTVQTILQRLGELLAWFQVVQPKVVAATPLLNFHKNCARSFRQTRMLAKLTKKCTPLVEPLARVRSRRELLFPDRMSIEHDCGKLRRLSILLRDLHTHSHKCLIFTQMTRMLDILEKFLNLHSYTYVRLDGGTKVESRQKAVDRFNLDPKVFCFLSSTRSGGLGLNLTAADTVIFYDTDWNPAMDKQAQDRCHRIGQTRSVHIYRLISSYTIEENILQKTLQKRHLDTLIMEGGQFNTEYLKQNRVNVRELFERLPSETLEEACRLVEDSEDVKAMIRAKREEEQDIKEFEDYNQLEFLDDLDPLARYCLNWYLTEHPPEAVEEEETVEMRSEPSESESEAFQVAPVEHPQEVFAAQMKFLKSRYIVY